MTAQGIREERTPAYAPDSNDVAENKNKQLKNMWYKQCYMKQH